MLNRLYKKMKDWWNDDSEGYALSLEAMLIIEKVVLVGVLLVVGALVYVFTFTP